VTRTLRSRTALEQALDLLPKPTREELRVLINDAAEALATPVAAPVKNKLNGSQKVNRRRLSGEQHPHSKLTDAQRADIVSDTKTVRHNAPSPESLELRHQQSTVSLRLQLEARCLT
jgi:hypothetical protein